MTDRYDYDYQCEPEDALTLTARNEHERDEIQYLHDHMMGPHNRLRIATQAEQGWTLAEIHRGGRYMTPAQILLVAEAFRDVLGECQIHFGKVYARDWQMEDLILSQMGSLDVFTSGERHDIRTRCLGQACVTAAMTGQPGPLASVLGLEASDVIEAVMEAVRVGDGPEAVRAYLSSTVGAGWDL